MDNLNGTLRQLMATDPAAFVAERDSLAKSLKASGDKDGAARIKSLRKPSAAVWLLNALAREQPRGVNALCHAMEQLRAAQGQSADALKLASRAHRDALNQLVDACEPLLRPGLPLAAVEQVRDHLRAMAWVSADVLDAWSGATLWADPQPAEAEDHPAPLPPVQAPPPVATPPTPPDDGAAAQKERDEAAAALALHAARVADAEAHLLSMERSVAGAAQQHATAREQSERAAQAAWEAQQAEAAAASHLEGLQQQLIKAQAALADARQTRG